MAGGGFAQLPDGSVIVALSLPLPRSAAPSHAARSDRWASDTAQAVVHVATTHGAQASVWPWRRHAPVADPWEPERRRWSAHADEAHTVRAASPRTGAVGAVGAVDARGGGNGEEPRVRVLVHSSNRPRALTRLRNLGLRAVYLRGNAEPPTPDEITAVLHHPEGLVWRGTPGDDTDAWHPIGTLLRHHPRAASTRPAKSSPPGV